jgi:hypothetical protein
MYFVVKLEPTPTPSPALYEKLGNKDVTRFLFHLLNLES